MLVALALLLGSGPARAQSNGDGSVYSRFGLGTLQDFSSSRSAALGRGGFALRSLNYTPSANPALWSDQVFTRLSGGAYYQNIQSTSGEGASSDLVAGSLEGLHFSFPLYTRTLGVALSFQPYTQYNYRTRRSGSLPVQVTPEQVANASYQVNFRGGGGLHRFRGGLGYRVTEALRVGASLDVLFGIIENQRNTDFGQAPLRNIRLKDATRLTGVGGTVGAHLALADVLSSGDNLSVGGAVTLPTTLTGDRVLTLTESQSVAPDTVSVGGQSSVDGSVSLPWRGRLGVAYQPNSRWTFTADGVFEPWSSFSSTFSKRGPLSRFPVGGEQTLTDRWRVSLGAEVLPAGSEQLTGYLANVAYRLGAYTEQLYIQPDGRTNVQMYAVTGGFSFPTSVPGTRIDLNLEAGTRGSTDGTLVRDNFFRVALHVNFGERWFQERRLR
ncbi:MAG: OmpP1/FadL family transporter [Salinibacter sp.]